MSGWEEKFPEELEEFPGAARPTPQQISDAIARVHKARREILPPSDEFLDAPIDPRLMAWVTKWEKNRIGWMECLENIIEEFPIADSVNSLEWMVRELKLMLRISAKKYRLEMKSILDEEWATASRPPAASQREPPGASDPPRSRSAARRRYG